REACKKAMGKLGEFFASDSDALLRAMRAMAPAMQRLLALTLQFDRVFADEKRRQGYVDFSDLEHLSAKLLIHEDGSPTELARQISLRYTEIMVDEYQDVNAVQDRLFHAVSREGKNLFMVGDVKQSIYRFRLADPGIFLEKYRSFAHMDDAAEGESRKILLRENFRSRKCVLDAANHVFSNIMSRELGELDYDDEASLRCGATYYTPDGEAPAELSVITLPDDGDEMRPDKALVEAQAVGQKIRRLIASKTPINDNGVLRPVAYGDIVILLRSPGAVGSTYALALSEQGIPVANGQGGAFFQAPEVSAVIAFLAVIDNPHQDVPLISALRSVLFGYSADELADIRAMSKTGSFFDALTSAAETNEKYAGFLEKLKSLREISGDLPTDALLRRVYNETDAMARLGAMPSGGERQENLMQLLDYAAKFEEDGFRGLFKFVASLRRMMERGTEPKLYSAPGGNAVTIMSIHKSKGLEFPVVFLCDTARKFNRQDAAETVLIHAELGLGPKFTDLDRGVEYPTIARRAIAAKLTEETLSEEMRILYVALTRAKERLYVTCAMKDPEKVVEKLRSSLSSPIPPQVLETAPSPAYWLIQTALLDQACLRLSIENGTRDDDPAPGGEADSVLPDENTVRKIALRLGFTYPHSAAADLPSKLTATELKDDTQDDPDSEKMLPRRRETVFRLPDLGAERALTGTEKGTAAHLVMQYIDFDKTATPELISGEIKRLERGGYLTPRQAKAVDPGDIEAFFRSETGRRILSADEVLREMPFSLLCDARDYFAGGDGDTLLLQGVVDCCIVEGNELTIIDYKTDYVNKTNLNQRVALYSGQVRTYAGAMRRITGKTVRECILYFLRGRCAAILDANGEKSV
ncbi:MAG: 3'-5' exonuclease, partial [Oscillospiraceae bacterium]